MQADEDWAARLLARMAEVIGAVAPSTWVVRVDAKDAPSLSGAIASGVTVEVGALTRDPRQRDHALPALALLLVRDGRSTLLPEDGMALQGGDELLLCGRPEAQGRMAWTAGNVDVLAYVLTGRQRPGGWIWRRLTGELGPRPAPGAPPPATGA
jgi:hypothetical protein